MCRRQNSKTRTISSAMSRPWWTDSQKSVSGKPGAVHFSSLDTQRLLLPTRIPSSKDLPYLAHNSLPASRDSLCVIGSLLPPNTPPKLFSMLR